MGRFGQNPRGGQRHKLPYLARKLLPVPVLLAAVTLGYFANDGGAVADSHESRIAKLASAPADQIIVGRATVIDGDTIEIAGQRIRFNGIDAPESAQYCQNASGKSYACGREAANALDGFLSASRPVSCNFVNWDQYGRFVGNCARADGTSVQGWLVESGRALDWPRYSKGAFAAQEATARKSRLGVWRGEFQKPWEWRVAQQEQAAPSTVTESHGFPVAAQSACNIKGNISAKRERIYHVPGQKYYDRTKVSEANGERWFCTEAGAKQAGWRKAKR